MEHVLYKDLKCIDIGRKLDLFEVKVHIVFLVTMGFSLRREGRYLAHHLLDTQISSFITPSSNKSLIFSAITFL